MTISQSSFSHVFGENIAHDIVFCTLFYQVFDQLWKSFAFSS